MGTSPQRNPADFLNYEHSIPYQAVENLDTALTMTISESDRRTISAANSELRELLQSHGVFIGCGSEPMTRVERFQRLENRLRAWKCATFPTGTPVRVDAPSYCGTGVAWMTGDYSAPVDTLEVLLENGNSWRYPIERCQPIPWGEVPRSNRRAYLRKKGYKLL